MTSSQWYLICWGSVGAVWALGWLYNVFFGPRVVEQRPGSPALGWLARLGLVVLVTRALPADFWAPVTFHADWL